MPLLKRKTRAVALDLDGTLYIGNEAIPHAPELVAALRERGLRLYFLTNNSGKSAFEIAAKLTGMGMPAAAEEVHNSLEAAVLYSAEAGFTSVYCIGTAAMPAAFAVAGIKVGADGEQVDAVICGIDPQFSYRKLDVAMNAILAGARFIACNRDSNFPVGAGRYQPGCGPLVAAIETACGKRPDAELGKPSPYLLQRLLARDGIAPCEVMVIGDSIESDIEMARAISAPYLLLGNDRSPPGIPTIRSLTELLEDLAEW